MQSGGRGYGTQGHFNPAFIQDPERRTWVVVEVNEESGKGDS